MSDNAERQSLPEGPLGYSVSEFIEKVPLGRSTAYAKIKTGEIPTVKIGKKKIIPFGWMRKTFGLAE